MQPFKLFLLLCIISGKLFAQFDRWLVITKTDSTTSFFTQIQSDIKNKSIGTFRDTIFQSDHRILQIIQYTNFESPMDDRSVWTIIDKYEFGNKDRLEKMEHWKTDNISRICRCGDWQYKRKGIVSLRRPFPNCNKKEFDCDINGYPVK